MFGDMDYLCYNNIVLVMELEKNMGAAKIEVFTEDGSFMGTARDAVLYEAGKVWRSIKEKVSELYPDFPQDFYVDTNARLRTTGGRVKLIRGGRTGSMELNENLLATNLDQVRMVYIHELSHLIQYHRDGYSNHDNAFHQIMESLGEKGTTYMPKNLNCALNTKPKKEYVYECEDGCEHKLTVRKHNKILKFGNGYSCRRTKKTLKFKEIRTAKSNNNFIGR